MYIDFHTHIIPGIDDGAKDVEEAVSMLTLSEKCGAETVILTPHVDASADYKEFVRVREEKVRVLKDALAHSGRLFPQLLLGAEVQLDDALSEKDDISPLLIEGTDLLLIELPYTPWNKWYNNEIYNIIAKHEVTPVMAHIERYLSGPKDIEKLDSLISFGVKFQVNASSFLTFSGRRVIRELAAQGLINAIGSDCHNLGKRSSDISKSLFAFEKKFGPEFLEYIYDKTLNLLEDNKLK